MDGGTVRPSYTEIFESACSYYLSIGMTLYEYWESDPSLVKYYREAHNYRRRMRNEELWIEGMYIASAIASSFDKKNKYPEAPFDIFPKTEIEKQEEAERNRQKIIEYFSLFKQRWNNKNGSN